LIIEQNFEAIAVTQKNLFIIATKEASVIIYHGSFFCKTLSNFKD